MSSMQFTVFTPTYNRLSTLPRLLESLKSQTGATFEWILVDDGSTDGTEEWSRTAQKKVSFPVRYFYQKNAGKHIAINTGLKEASGEWFFVLDSDDYLRPNALRTCTEILERVKESYAGFSGIHFSDKVAFDPDQFGKKSWTEGAYVWPHPGEMTFIYRTEIARRFPFPVFEGEKFCQESLVHRRIAQEYPVLFTDYVLVGGDYLPDGLSQDLWQRIQKSPTYGMLNYAERIQQKTAQNPKEELEFAKLYWKLARLSNKVSWFQKLTAIPLRLTWRVFLTKFLNAGK